MHGRIFYLTQKMKENLEYQWTVGEMADMVDLSQPHLQKLFRAETGLSPLAYLKNLRLDLARTLLEDSFQQVKQICVETGLYNQSHFASDFKKRFGLTPTEYRKEYWAIEQSPQPNG